MQSSVQFILAFIVVLALIGLTAWLVRRFAGNRLGANASRGRLPRLAVIDAAAVDGRRRLVLVRRDNVEHLLMIGGPSDIVVEANIVRAIPGREQAPQRAGLGADMSPRSGPLDTPSWAAESSDAGSEPEPQIPEPPSRPARPSFIEEPRRPIAPLPERRPEPVASFTPEPLPRPEPRPEPVASPSRPIPRSEMPRSEPTMPRPMRADPPIRSTPPLRTPERPTAAVAPTPPAPVVAPPVEPSAPAPATAPAISSADQNLADMAQRLEAALRRPSSETRSEAPEPRIGAPSVAPDAPASRIRTPEVSIASAARAEAPPVAPPVKSGFENLEDEMASLLGRPKSSS